MAPVSFIIPVCWWCNFLIRLYSGAKLCSECEECCWNQTMIASLPGCNLTMYLYCLGKSSPVHTSLSSSLTSMLAHTRWAIELSVMQEGETGVETELASREELWGPTAEVAAWARLTLQVALRLNSPHLWGDYLKSLSIQAQTNVALSGYRRLTQKHSSLIDYIHETAQISINVYEASCKHSPLIVHLTLNWQKEKKAEKKDKTNPLDWSLDEKAGLTIRLQSGMQLGWQMEEDLLLY